MKIIRKTNLGKCKQSVYDLSVKNNHNYMITESDIIVHNSGKSYVADHTVEGLGLKMVNSDPAFEFLLNKAGLSTKLADLNDEEFQKAMSIRNKAKSISDKQFEMYIDGRLGLVIDGTGKDFNKIKRVSDNLKSLGYDTYMIFVNTSLDVAQERNLQRERSIKAKDVEDFWKQVQSNIGRFQNYFGTKNFIVVDNNDADEDVFVKVHKRIKNLLSEPVENYKAKQWIQKELEKKK